MQSWLGLIEMGLVLVLGLGWGLHELRALKRDRTTKPDKPSRKDRDGGSQ